MGGDASNGQTSASQLGPLEVGDSTTWAARPMAEWREKGYVPDSDEEDDVGWGIGLSTAISPTAPVAPPTSEEPKSTVGIGELTWGVEIEHIGGAFAVASGNHALSQKAESILAKERRSGENQSDPSCTTGAHEIASASVGDQLQAELEYGLQSVREILGNAYVQSRSNSVNHSHSSSPLSSIRSFTDDDEAVESAGHNKLVHSQTNRSTEAEPTDWHYQHDSHPRHLGRELRRRNPIQIHPYALEDARYQQELKARGLKPVRIAPVNSGAYQNPAADDTQHQDLFSSNQVDDSAGAQSIGDVHSSLRSQNISSPEASRAARSPRPLELFEDDGELPELSAILNGDIPNRLPNKRRKVAHKSYRETSQPLAHREFHIPELPPADFGRARHGDMGIDMFEIPHSPPHSGSSNVSSALMTPNDISRPPQRLTPFGLPTPVASSLTKALSEPGIETDNSSEISEGSQTDGSSVRGSSPLAADRRQWKGIQNVQRRIKGVLPASWLTLDLDKQTVKKKPRRPSVSSPVQKSVAKGVAQKLKTSKPRRSLTEDGGVPVIDISEDSASDTSHSSPAKASVGQPQLFEDHIDDFEPSLGDVVEDNHIDMLPPLLSRVGRKGRLPVKGQRTLNERFGTTGIFPLDRSRSLKARHERTKQPKAKDRFDERRKHSHSKPVPVALQLEILDAPSFAQLSADDQPQFLKIAARRARTRRGKSRSGQLSKHVRSNLEANTKDVYSRLLVPGESRVRSQGKNLPSLPGRSLAQGPLPGHQPDQRTSDVPGPSTKPIRAAIPNPEQIASLKTSTASTIHRILLRQVGNSAFTTLDDYSTEPKASNTHPVLPQPSLPSRLLSHYENRSGKGRMISSFAQPRGLRSAQLEAFQSPTRHIPGKSLPPQGPPQSRKRVPQHRRMIKTHEWPSGNAVVSSPTVAGTLRPLNQPLLQHPPRPPVAEEDQIAATLQRGQVPFLIQGTFYHESTLIGSGDLAETILRILKTPRSLHLNNGDSRSFSLPNTKVLYTWDAWNPTVASQFISVCQTLFQECSFAITTKNNALHATLARLTQYLRRIIDYINHVLYFEDATARTLFVTTCVEILLPIVISTEQVLDEVQGPVLHILNHAIVLAYQVSHIASAAPVEHGLQLRAWDLFDTIAGRILSLTLSGRGQSKLLEYLRVNKIRSERERGIRMDYPEVDALVIVSHLCNGKILGESCSTMICKILATKLEGHDGSRAHDSIVEVMAFIWTIAPFFSIKDTGCLGRRRLTKDDFGCWPVVLSVFEAFLKSRTHSKDPIAPDNIIGRRYIHFCVHLATGWGWIDCAGLVQLLRTQYGSNNMDELFAEKGSNTRDFLDNYPGYGRIPSPFDNDSGFDSFLKLIITSGIQKASRSEKISNLSNFIFSLVPNSGQLVRKNQNHDHRVLRPLQNRHDLYSALYFISPLETKIRLLPQIQSLVDLRESHIKACTISRETLIRLLRFQISTDEDPRILYDFSKLIQDMIKKMEGLFDAARLEAFAQVGGVVSREDALSAVRFNQRNIQKFLRNTIQAWSDCIRDCRTPDQARYLLFGEDWGVVLGLCNRTIALDPESMTADIDAFRDDVIEVILSTITSYIITWLPKSDNLKELIDLLHHPLKGVLSTQLGRFEQCGDEVLKSLTDCWHAFAKVSVDAGVRSWDNYLSLGGRDAWQSFDDTWHKRQYEVYFVARFVEYNKEAWREWQIPILQLWIASLLQPDMRFKYQADLTTQIMRNDASFNPLLFHLPLVIYEDEVLVEVNFDELVTARTPLIVALLRNMNKITTRPDSQDTIFGPSQDDCSAILKNMIAQMKQYLQEFEREPDNFEVYTAFVGRILSEMRIYTNHLEPVPEFFEYRPGKSLSLVPDTIKAKLKTYKQLLIDNVMEKHMIVFMHTTAERAAITGQQKALEDQLVSVFLDLNSESIEDAEGYAADAHFRTLFFQNVFPAYLDRIFHGPGFIIAQPILQCILMVYKSLRFRFGFWRKDFLEPFTTATLTLLATLKTTLASPTTSQEHILSDPSQLRAYAYLSLLMFEILCRCQEMEDSFGPFGALADIWEYFLFFYKFTCTVAFRSPRALPGRPPDDDDDDDQIPLLEPELSRTDAGMLAYSRQELGDRLDFKWLPGAGGKWHVRGAGGRRELVQGDGGVRILEEEARDMHTAAEKYVRAFSALWDTH